MITYLLHTTSIWIVLFIVYKALLSNEKYFILNRVYLLSSLALGLLLPLLQFVNFTSQQVIPEVSAIYHQQVSYISELSSSVRSSGVEATYIDWTAILFFLVSIGMAAMLIKNIIAGYKINDLYKQSEKLRHPEFTEVRTSKEHLPFSFFRYIFFSAFKLNESDKLAVLNHEIHHVRAKHTWDVLLIEAIKVFFWWNPLVYLYKRAITENHEYAADHAAIMQGSRKDYCALLLQSNMPGVNLNLGNPFFQTYIKKRIDMMYRSQSTWKSYLKFVLPLLAVIFMAFVIQEDKLILDYRLDSQYIDLFAGDDLLNPGDDYLIDHDAKKVIISNKNYINAEGISYCMFIIDEPRPLTDFQNIQKPKTEDFIEVQLSVGGVSKVGSKKMSTKEIFNFVDSLEKNNQREIHIKLTINDRVESENVAAFLDEAFKLNTKVILINKESKTDGKIPSISPISSKDIHNSKDEGNTFGMRMHPVHKVNKFHKGVDFIARVGTPIFATADGVVTEAKANSNGYGNHVVISHDEGYSSMYAHMEKYIVKEGDKLVQGDQIGFVGSSGASTQPHLHYEVRKAGKAVNPIGYGVDLPELMKKGDEISVVQKSNKLIEDRIEENVMSEDKEIDAINEQDDLNQNLVKGAENLFGLENPLDNEGEMKIGRDLTDGVGLRVYAISSTSNINKSKIVLKEGIDYTIDREKGTLRIINPNYDLSIYVEFGDDDSNENFFQDKGKDIITKKVKSDMTYDSECKSNKNGVYFRTDKGPTLLGCDTGNVEDYYSCSTGILSEYVAENMVFPENLVKGGFEGRLMYTAIIDENGLIESYTENLRQHKKRKLPELEAEGIRLVELIKSKYKFAPAECDGHKVKSIFHFSIFFRLDEVQMKRVDRRDASNTSQSSQRVVIDRIASGGGSFTYTSDMNVPYVVKVTDPNGEVIFNETYDFIYDYDMDGFVIPKDINGKYTIEVTQDGQTVKNEITTELF